MYDFYASCLCQESGGNPKTESACDPPNSSTAAEIKSNEEVTIIILVHAQLQRKQCRAAQLDSSFLLLPWQQHSFILWARKSAFTVTNIQREHMNWPGDTLKGSKYRILDT